MNIAAYAGHDAWILLNVVIGLFIPTKILNDRIVHTLVKTGKIYEKHRWTT